MGKQVKVVVSTPTNYRPATNNAGTGVPGTKAGAAPTVAPSQTVPVTGTGPLSKNAEGFQAPGSLAPQPASNGGTGPQIAEPSVDYDTQQGTRIPADVYHHPHAVTPLGEQDQRT